MHLFGFTKMPICIPFKFSCGGQHYRVQFRWQKNYKRLQFYSLTDNTQVLVMTILVRPNCSQITKYVPLQT